MRAKRAIGQGHVLALPGVTPQAVLSSQPGNPARRGLRASGNRAPPHGGEASRGDLPLFDCSLPLAADRAGKPPTLSSLADEKRVGSLLRSAAARDPVRATTTAAGSERDVRAA
jgi:hypothetical protein